MKKIIKKVGEALLGLLFPDRCVLCDRTVWKRDNGICPACRPMLIFSKEPRCLKCGKMIKRSDREYCGDCIRLKHFFDRGFSLFVYNDPLRKSIYRLKYKQRQRYGYFFGKMAARHLARELGSLKADAIVPVPLHPSRERSRGYNQAAVIARSLGEELGIPVVEDYVLRTKNTVPLKLLEPAERQNNLKNAFKIGQYDVKLNSIVLVDDIYTTGSTIDEISSLLKSSGTACVYFVTVAAGAQQ